MRRSMFDDFVYYDTVKDEIILSARDVKLDSAWDWFHHSGTRVWWTKGFIKPKHWELIDRQCERYFATPIKI